MKVTISFLHLEHTEALDEKIHEKTAKLEKFMNGKTSVKWSCYVKGGKHYAEVDLIGPHFEYHAHGNTDSLYKTIDIVAEKLEKQLLKKKDRWDKRRKSCSKADLVALEPDDAWDGYEDYTYEEKVA